MAIPAELRREIIARAEDRCEYCGLSQASQEAVFHVDHIMPLSVGGATASNNLALACVSCSLRKGARQDAIDPESGVRVRLFHPREDRWTTHFYWEDVRMVARTAVGRATINALRLNRELALAIRAEELFAGRHPPPGPAAPQASS
jgi:hypothetical protein